jgi:hypothetical protein
MCLMCTSLSCTSIARKVAGRCARPISERFSAWLSTGSIRIADTLSEKGNTMNPSLLNIHLHMCLHAFATYITVLFSGAYFSLWCVLPGSLPFVIALKRKLRNTCTYDVLRIYICILFLDLICCSHSSICY